MIIGWIVIEVFINIIEECTIFYLLCKKFSAKYKTFSPTLLFLSICTVILSIPLFFPLPFVEIIIFALWLGYLLFFRTGSIWKKIFWVSLCTSLLFAIGFITITIISFIDQTDNLSIMVRIP